MRTRIIWAVAVAIVSCTGVARAEPNKPTPLDGLLEPLRAAQKVPALAAAVVREGETVAIGAVGLRKDGAPDRVTVDDRWHIGSCTKSMTAVLAAMLVEEGAFRWDMTLAEMFPDMASQMQAEWRGVTLEQLLWHRGGAPHELDGQGLWGRVWERVGRPPREQRDYLTRELLTQQGPVATPGTRGQGTLLSPETFKRLHRPFGDDGDYAGGWVVTRRSWGGGEVLTHGGSNTMFYAVIWLAPIKDFAVVVCTNVGGDVGAKATDVTAGTLIKEYLPESTP